MSKNIKGITVEIGAETSGLDKALSNVNKSTRDIQKELREVDKLLKFNPKDTELLSQKQKLLGDAVNTTKEKLDKLKEAEKQVQEQFKKGDISEEQYREFQREIVATEGKLKHYEGQLESVGNKHKEMAKKVEDAGKSIKETGDKISGVGKDMSAKVTLPLVAAGGASFKFAADLEDAMGATEQIYKESSGEVKAWADSLESYYGIAEGDALEYANIMGAMLQNIGGLSEAEAAKQSAMLTELAGDLSAMFGGTTESAVQALTGALKGNNSMLDNYGMGVNDATIKTKALEMGLYDGTGQMDLQSKQAATLALIMEQTADAQGQAGREADGASGSMKTLTTELKNIATDIGQVLMPIMMPFIEKLKELTGKFKELSPETQSLIVKVGLIAAAVGPLLVVFGTLVSSVGLITTAFGLLIGKLASFSLTTTLATIKTTAMTVATNVWGVAAKAGAIATKLLGGAVAFLTSPFGIALIAIAAIIAIGVTLWKNWDTIKTKAGQLGSYISTKFNQIGDFISKPINAAKEKVSGAINAIKGFFTNLKLKLPKISMPKLPKFELTGKFSFKPPSVPKLGIKWNKDGAIFNKPYIFGNQGVGEAGPEAVLPIEKLGGIMAETLRNMDYNGNNNKVNNNSIINHTGTIQVKGVNDKNELQGVVDIVMDELRREVRSS